MSKEDHVVYSCRQYDIILKSAMLLHFSRAFFMSVPLPNSKWRWSLWNDLVAEASSPFTLLRQVLSRVMLSTNFSLILVAPLLPQKKWFADMLALLVEEPLMLLLLWNPIVQPHIRKFHSHGDAASSLRLSRSSDG